MLEYTFGSVQHNGLDKCMRCIHQYSSIQSHVTVLKILRILGTKKKKTLHKLLSKYHGPLKCQESIEKSLIIGSRLI